ncbi:MAG TPA: hypothetical protein PLU49_03795 [Saprospiraceae bacterium]|nr:hypothetical protein [Saprospiraceae bacterium]
MENKAPIDDILVILQKSGPSYETKVPDDAFNRIESRLDALKQPKRFDIQNIAAYAAITLSIAVSVLILTLHLKDRFHNIPGEEQYVVQLLSLDENRSAYPSYDIHKLMKAYQSILNSETEMKESGLGMEIRVNN